MPRPSRDPNSGAEIIVMSAENRARYERMKDRQSGVGGRGLGDRWGWADADPQEPWPLKRDQYRRNLWPDEGRS